VWSDSKGDLWISEWNTGQLAKYSPATGQWARYPLPTQARSQLYAVYVDNKDVVWVSNWGDDKIYSFDPKTLKFTSVAPSRPNAGVRQINGAPGVVMIPESEHATVMTINTGGSAS
jgi:virginiamycin B lyase